MLKETKLNRHGGSTRRLSGFWATVLVSALVFSLMIGIIDVPISKASTAVPAFPGAQGGGAISAGGRGGAVIKVTNLNDSGPGSLRACATASGPRTCVFTVGGTINLMSTILITNPNLTIAGQTAPGGGILIKGTNMSDNMIMVGVVGQDANVIIRYLRLRKGYNANGDDSGGAIEIYNGNNIILDHISVSWNQDEGIGVWKSANISTKNVTSQYNIMAEGLYPHSTGLLAGGEGGQDTETDIDMHHNLIMNDTHRNPLLKTKSSRVVNNITYNQSFYLAQVGGGISVDFIGNKYKKGPLYGVTTYESNFYPHEIQAFPQAVPYDNNTAHGDPSIYLSGNVGWNQTNPSGNQWLLTSKIAWENEPETGAAIPASWKRTTPLPNTTYPIAAEPVGNIEDSILPTVGASQRISCDGAWVPARDSVDTRLINQYQTNTGINFIITNESQVGGYPTIAGGTPCTDTDNDGMPDAWEISNFGNLNQTSNGDFNNDGYTNLEKFMNGMLPVSASALVSNLTVNDIANAANWSVRSNIRIGDLVYGDRANLFASMPSSMAGSDWIRPANDSKSYTGTTLASFKVNASSDVYVAHNDAIAVKPSWMSSWTDTGQDVTSDAGLTYSLYKKNYASGSTVSLGNNGDASGPSNYFVIMKNATGPLVSNLTVNDASNAANWSIRSNIRNGDLVYGDRTTLFTSMPSSVAGSDWIRPANDSKSYTGTTLASFKVNAASDVYIAHNDAISAKPSWMSSWTDTGQDVTTDAGLTYSLYKKSFASGSTVSLGNNGDASGPSTYFVIVK
ncbi:hypothetical protein D7Z26_08020 [Cohnella endophytica]|uniref:Pectate lyase n=1 Tax=Cohnella endophytica TaxID=2419778 RepID=A0A494XZH3_9BACL|nr:hypothetical protein [Cohnella endophytica]RKP55158.1 hypothetical protein D7Z26_08020 [Cohnella endophytica]